MNEPKELDKVPAAIRAPRAAALAGVAFALILGSAMVLIRLASPPDAGDAAAWAGSPSRLARIELALVLLPFAGIAFLWFIGVIRDHLGPREDRLFATVFLGSGLLFLALMFSSGAVVASLVRLAQESTPSPEIWSFGRRISLDLMRTYGLRMAAIFVMSATTLAGRLGLLVPWLRIAGYITAVSLLFFVGLLPGLELLFPVWVLLISIHILLAPGRIRPVIEQS